MYIQYGNYQHAPGEGALSILQRTEYSTSGMVAGTRVRLELRGRLQIEDQGSDDANQAAMTEALAALELAYSVNGQDFGLYQDDGSPTEHVLRSAATVGGVKITQPVSYPVGRGAEYSTFRNYELAVEGFVPSLFATILDWRETVQWSGGGPQFVILQTLTGPPQKQLTSEQSVCRATQTGSAVGAFSYVAPSAPLWPDALVPEASSVSQVGPDREGPFGIPFFRYRTNWTYSFADPSPLVGAPNFWGS